MRSSEGQGVMLQTLLPGAARGCAGVVAGVKVVSTISSAERVSGAAQGWGLLPVVLFQNPCSSKCKEIEIGRKYMLCDNEAVFLFFSLSSLSLFFSRTLICPQPVVWSIGTHVCMHTHTHAELVLSGKQQVIRRHPRVRTRIEKNSASPLKHDGCTVPLHPC